MILVKKLKNTIKNGMLWFDKARLLKLAFIRPKYHNPLAIIRETHLKTTHLSMFLEALKKVSFLVKIINVIKPNKDLKKIIWLKDA